MKKTLLIGLLVILSACSPSKETHFDKHGVSVTSPKGWEITEEDIDGEGYSVNIEKEGFDSSGLVNITWVNVLVDEEEFIALFIESFGESMFINMKEDNYSAVYVSKYGDYTCKTVDYSLNILGLKHNGKIHSFQTEEKTFIILVQEALEDHEKNKEGFRIIEESLLCL